MMSRKKSESMLMSELSSARRGGHDLKHARHARIGRAASGMTKKRNLKRVLDTDEKAPSSPPKKMRKRARELLLHSETMNDSSDEADERGVVTGDDSIESAFARR